MQQKMVECPQSIDEVRAMVHEARKKPPPAPATQAEFNEEEYMDNEMMHEDGGMMQLVES
jgi:hypothetical protein